MLYAFGNYCMSEMLNVTNIYIFLIFFNPCKWYILINIASVVTDEKTET